MLWRAFLRFLSKLFVNSFCCHRIGLTICCFFIVCIFCIFFVHILCIFWTIFPHCLSILSILRRCGSQFLDNVLADVVGPASEPAQATQTRTCQEMTWKSMISIEITAVSGWFDLFHGFLKSFHQKSWPFVVAVRRCMFIKMVSAVSGSSCCVSGCSQDGGSAVALLNPRPTRPTRPTVHSWQHDAAQEYAVFFFFASNLSGISCSGQLSCSNPSTGEVTRQDSSDLMFWCLMLLFV